MGYDVIVLGLGGMGSATARSLARRGAKVLGIEQFGLGHALGSSHGNTRLIRQAYFEESRYVPLAKRAYALWDEIEREGGRRLFHRTGLLIMGPDGDGGMGALKKLVAAAKEHDVPVELIPPDDLRRRFPAFRPPHGYRGVLEPGAGFLEVENGVRECAAQATKAGAVLRFEEPAVRWDATASGVSVTTVKGTYRADKLVVAAGPWSGAILRELNLPLVVWRVPQLWFDAPEEYAEERGIPCFAFDRPEGFLYGFPRRDGVGLKMADYHPEVSIVKDPSAVDRSLYPQDVAKVARCVAECLPGVSTSPRASAVCMYTMTPDENFILDVHPRHPNVSLAAGFSGHGYKFAPAIGEIMADLALAGKTGESTAFLKLRW